MSAWKLPVHFKMSVALSCSEEDVGSLGYIHEEKT